MVWRVVEVDAENQTPNQADTCNISCNTVPVIFPARRAVFLPTAKKGKITGTPRELQHKKNCENRRLDRRRAQKTAIQHHISTHGPSHGLKPTCPRGGRRRTLNMVRGCLRTTGKIRIHKGESAPMRDPGKSKTALKNEMQRQLHKQFQQGRGNSKRAAKAANGGVSPAIHSRATLTTYKQQCNQYADWLSTAHPGCTWEDAKNHVQEYIDQGRANGWSAWTQQTARSAIGKALGVKPTALAKTDIRHFTDIKRGRVETPKAAKAAAKYDNDLQVCACVGVRHGREAGQVTPANCHWENGHITSVSLVGKGGRAREATVLPGKGRDILEARCKAAKSPGQQLLSKMPGCNVHAMRAKYAAGIYAKAKAEGRTSGQTYTPEARPDRHYDTGALDYVNENLGHGAGRYDVAVNNYDYGDWEL